MLCHIRAPKNSAINLKLGNGRQVLVQAGETQQFDLTGDEIGYVQNIMDDPDADNPNHAHKGLNYGLPEAARGFVKCPEREVSDASPPVGSKKHRGLHPDEYADGEGGGPHKSDRAAVKARAEAKAAEERAAVAAKVAADAAAKAARPTK